MNSQMAQAQSNNALQRRPWVVMQVCGARNGVELLLVVTRLLKSERAAKHPLLLGYRLL